MDGFYSDYEDPYYFEDPALENVMTSDGYGVDVDSDILGSYIGLYGHEMADSMLEGEMKKHCRNEYYGYSDLDDPEWEMGWYPDHTPSLSKRQQEPKIKESYPFNKTNGARNFKTATTAQNSRKADLARKKKSTQKVEQSLGKKWVKSNLRPEVCLDCGAEGCFPKCVNSYFDFKSKALYPENDTFAKIIMLELTEKELEKATEVDSLANNLSETQEQMRTKIAQAVKNRAASKDIVQCWGCMIVNGHRGLRDHNIAGYKVEYAEAVKAVPRNKSRVMVAEFHSAKERDSCENWKLLRKGVSAGVVLDKANDKKTVQKVKGWAEEVAKTMTKTKCGWKLTVNSEQLRILKFQKRKPNNSGSNYKNTYYNRKG